MTTLTFRVLCALRVVWIHDFVETTDLAWYTCLVIYVSHYSSIVISLFYYFSEWRGGLQCLKSPWNPSHKRLLRTGWRSLSYASRPLSEFKTFEALEMLEALQNVSHDSKHDREAYYRSVYQTARSKVELPNEYFRSLLLRLLGDKDDERVFDTVTKVEKNIRRKNRTIWWALCSESRGLSSEFWSSLFLLSGLWVSQSQLL